YLRSKENHLIYRGSIDLMGHVAPILDASARPRQCSPGPSSAESDFTRSLLLRLSFQARSLTIGRAECRINCFPRSNMIAARALLATGGGKVATGKQDAYRRRYETVNVWEGSGAGRLPAYSRFASHSLPALKSLRSHLK